MKYFDWSNKKNEKLKTEREISFESILIAIDEKKILDIVEHKNQKRYPNQKMFVIDINGYAYLDSQPQSDQEVYLEN